jgi:hypothetical protein
MKFTLNILEKRSDRNVDRSWPGHMFGGRVRTSTIVLIVVFLAIWWAYDTYRPESSAHEGPPATQVVPPGFVPDPNYTWVPRSQVQQPPAVTSTPTPTPTTTTTTEPPPPPPVTTTTAPPPFVLPTLPCIPPFCTPSPTPAAPPGQLPQPGPAPLPIPGRPGN